MSLAVTGKRIDGVEFASFNERSDGCPVLGTYIVAREKGVLALKGNRLMVSSMVVADLDTAVG